MDTTETYIKMCEKAEEIQAFRSNYRDYEDGDICYLPNDDPDMDGAYHQGISITWNGLIPNAGYHDYDSWWASVPEEAIWLPHQDQLQEIVEDPEWDGYYFVGQGRYDRPRALTMALYEFVKDAFRSESMEQLWLAFVMKEKYGKVWSGEDWIPANFT